MKHDLDVDNLIRKTLIGDGLEHPGIGFSDKVMTAVVEEKMAAETYKPLFSKKLWIAMVSVLAVITIVVLFIPAGSIIGLPLNTGIMDKLTDPLMQMHLQIAVPKTLIVIATSALLMLFTQALMISKFIRKLL